LFTLPKVIASAAIYGRRGKIHRKLDYFLSFFEISVLNLFGVSEFGFRIYLNIGS
jgi:hypothetical protein